MLAFNGRRSSLKIINTGLRGITLLSKFLLIFFLVKFLSPAEVGEYGLITVTIGYLLYFLGLDFYTYSTREMLAASSDHWGKILRDQAALYACAYVLSFPVVLLIFAGGLFSWHLVIIFYLLLVLEHLNQEINRVLIAISKPVMANIVLFFRGGVWCYVILGVFFIFPVLQSIKSLLLCWLAADIVALIPGVYCLRNINWQACKSTPVDWRWIGRGLKIASKLLLGTLALRGIVTFDRYILAFFESKSLVGVYSFYMSIANVIPAFMDASVFVFFYPKLVELFSKKNINEYTIVMRKMIKQVTSVICVLSALAIILIIPVIRIVHKEIYSEYLLSFFILLAAIVVFCLGMIPNYGLYAMKKDKAIFFPHIWALFVFLFLAFILIPLFGLPGAAFSILITYSFLGIVKFLFYRKYFRVFLAQKH